MTAVAYPLQQQVENGGNIADAAVNRDCLFIPVQQQEAIHKKHRDDGGKCQTKGGDGDDQDSFPKAAQLPQLWQAEATPLHGKEDDCHDHGHGLSDDGRPCSTGHSPVQGPHEGIVQDNVRYKSENHRNHGNGRAAHVADKRDEAGCQKLKNRAQRNDAGIRSAEREHIASCAQQIQNWLGKSKQDRRQQTGDNQHQQRRTRKALLTLLGFPLRAQDRKSNGARQAKPRTDRSHQRGDRIAQCDGGQSRIAEALPDKEAVNDGVNPRQRECENGRNDIRKEFLT